jgi:hypothetical protein
MRLANAPTILNSGAGPTPDGPEALVETLSDLNRVSGLADVRVADLASDLAEVVSESLTRFRQVAKWHHS